MNLGHETETLEFKKTTGELKEAVISICAILNKHQKGELYFGIKPDGSPVGQEISEKTLREISQAVANHIEPQIFPEITTVQLDGKDCISVRFEGHNIPYFAYGIARIRVADEDKTMSQQELLDFIRKQQNAEDSWERGISPFTVDDVSERRVSEYVERGRAAGRLEFPYSDKETALKKLLLTNGKNLLNAGMVLFCDSMYAELQLAIFAGTERLTFLDIQRQHGTVFELVSLAERYITSNIHWRVKFDGTLQRKEIPEIPVDAIREALINSFCHKNYGACQSNEVAIYKDRVEIYNPGSFPDGYSPEDFIDGRERPVRRNPLITSILYYSKDVESFGTGLKRIADACNAAKCRFRFEILKSGFVVVFYRSEALNGEIDTNTENPATTTDTTTEKAVTTTEKAVTTTENPATTTDTTTEKAVTTTDHITDKALDVAESVAPDTIPNLIIEACAVPKSRDELMKICGLKNKNYFIQTYLKPLILAERIVLTIPNRPASKNQKYVVAKLQN